MIRGLFFRVAFAHVREDLRVFSVKVREEFRAFCLRRREEPGAFSLRERRFPVTMRGGKAALMCKVSP